MKRSRFWQPAPARRRRRRPSRPGSGAGHQRQADQAVGAEHAQQLLLGRPSGWPSRCIRPGGARSAASATAPPLFSGIENSAMRWWSRRAPTSIWPVGFSSRITVLSKSNRMRAERVIDSSRPLSPCWRAKVWPTSDTSTRLRTSSDRRCWTGSTAARHRPAASGCRRRRPGRCRGGPPTCRPGARPRPAWRRVRFGIEAAQAAPSSQRGAVVGMVDIRCARRTMRIRGCADSRRSLGSWWYSTASARKESSCQRSISQAPASAWVICRVRCSTAHRSSSSRAVKLKAYSLGAVASSARRPTLCSRPAR
jgi:hypothetical protein